MNNFWKGKKVLITGAEGFIGSNLTEELAKKGAKARVFIFYNSFGKWGWFDHTKKNLLKNIEIFAGDIRDPYRVSEAVKGQEVVLHLASLIGIPYSYCAPDSYIDTNVKGTLNILNACRSQRIERFIYTSTSEVYGTAKYTPIDEKHPLQPQSPYSASKIAAENISLSYYYSFGVPVSVLRPFNTYGPRQSARAIIPTVISQIYAGKKIIELGNLAPTRDFNYVKDTANAFIKLAETSKVEGEIFNAGSGREISIKDLVELIIEITGKRVKVANNQNRLRPKASEVQRLICDNTKIRESCGWKPTVTLEQGLEMTCRWIKDHLDSCKTSVYNI
ncbi:MAG: dTDP-glucose 4,6-dehydratase [Elusimicrobia bacterium ADurb.Bin231]|nr:MAG: dTDP-glucose 4,6-dehydratase [Elusimicrobia bacterium ADurb.Bin231]